MLRESRSPDSFLALNSSSSRTSYADSADPSLGSAVSRANRSIFFGALADNIEPLALNLNNGPVRMHTPEQRPVITTLAPPVAPAVEEKDAGIERDETQPAGGKEKNSSIIYWNEDDYLEKVEPQVDYVELALKGPGMKKITKAKWQMIAQGLRARPMEGSTKESIVRAILQNPIMKQYIISDSNLSGIGSDAKLYEIGELAKDGKIDNSIIPITSLAGKKASRR